MASTVNSQVNANDGRDPRQLTDGERAGQVVKRIVDPVVEQVRPGVWSVPVFWPRSPLRYTLAYLLSADGAVLVDTGWPTDAGWDSLVGGVRQTGHDITDIQEVLVTQG